VPFFGESFLSAWWVSPVPSPVIGSAPAVLDGRVACAAEAIGSLLVGAYMPSSNVLPPCGSPTATTVVAVPPEIEVEM
jgi:hypothetical protein